MRMLQGITPFDGELGAGLAHDESPHAQACALYVVRVAVVQQLGEAGQLLLLERLHDALLVSQGGNEAPIFKIIMRRY